MTDELKPCPFCGGESRLFQMTAAYNWLYGGKHFARCNNPLCYILPSGKPMPTKAAAIAAWNRRAMENDGGGNE